jgi:hypothetical protein
MEAIEYYQRAISIIANDEFDSRQLAIRLAQRDPAMFCELVGLNPKGRDEWISEYLSLVKTSQYVPAIKQLRSVHGYGLKEAKDITDNVRIYMINKGYPLTTPLGFMYNTTPKTLDVGCEQVYQNIVRFVQPAY